MNTVSRAVNSALAGAGPLVNYTVRAEDDARDGVVRLTDGNWDELVGQGAKDELWAIVIYVSIPYLAPPSGPS